MSRQVPVVKWKESQRQQQIDVVAEEAALAIDVNGELLTLTMRTPGDDIALTMGLLFAEGIITASSDVKSVQYASDPAGHEDRNRLLVELSSSSNPLPRTGWERRFPSTSSCGVCGKTDIDSVQCITAPLAELTPVVEAATFYTLNESMRAAQTDFSATGGLHAAALFDNDGSLILLREDIGRHNAVDKVVGTELIAGRMPLRQRILMISGRASFEIIQKATVARIPIVCAVSAPSSLAVRLAHDMNITLIGFLRGKTMNVYSATSRIIQPSDC